MKKGRTGEKQPLEQFEGYKNSFYNLTADSKSTNELNSKVTEGVLELWMEGCNERGKSDQSKHSTATCFVLRIPTCRNCRMICALARVLGHSFSFMDCALSFAVQRSIERNIYVSGHPIQQHRRDLINQGLELYGTSSNTASFK
jgi:hypothetical protein